MKRTPEGQLQRLVLDWLAAKHIFAIRMQTGVLRNPAGRPVTFGIPGQADILAFIQCEYFTLPWFIELKSKDGKQSDLQRSFQSQVEGNGIEYLLARSLEDVERTYLRIKSGAFRNENQS